MRPEQPAVPGCIGAPSAVGIIHLTGPKLARLAGKYRPLAPALRELIRRPDTLLEADVKDMIASQFDAGQGRFTAISHGHPGTSEPPGGLRSFS
jgi:hypothetical protein